MNIKSLYGSLVVLAATVGTKGVDFLQKAPDDGNPNSALHRIRMCGKRQRRNQIAKASRKRNRK